MTEHLLHEFQRQCKLWLLSLTPDVATTATTEATKVWASTGHCPHHPRRLCSLAMPRAPGPAPQGECKAPSGRSNILKVSTTTGTFQLWLLDSPLWPSWASEPSLAAAFALLLPGQGTGEQHISRGGTRDKAKGRGYVTKEEDDCAHWKQVQAGVKPD